jgi:hypothetical protein
MKRKVLILLTLGALAAWAQVYDGPNDAAGGPTDADGVPTEAYDPSHGVARVSVLEGEVSLGRGDSNELTAAAQNAPVMAHDRLLTGLQARAEVQLDRENILRLGNRSEVRFNDLEYGRYQVQVATGTVTLTLFGQTKTQGEVDTPSVSVRALGPGAYRISVREDGVTEVTVRSGEAEIYTPRGTQRVQQGQTMEARGPASDPEFQMVQAIPLDEWDRWNQGRDEQYQQQSERAYQYVSPEITGAEDLEGNGQWVDEQPYGNVWVPNVAADWAPYRYGRWAWEDWYGWTWVSSDPWGWAPYHYGRWFMGHHGWCWYPGGRYSSHYWSPALVAFFGFGHGGVGFGFGNVGWVPLAPYERFHPWWGRGGYRHDVVVNNFNVYSSYRNARLSNGVTAVHGADFGRRGFNGNYTRVGAAELTRASLVRGQVPVTPTRESYRVSDRAVQTGRMPQTGNLHFAQRGSFGGTQTRFRGSAVAPRQQTPVAHGWGRFGEPVHSASPQSGSWQRFNPQGVTNGGGSRPWTAPGVQRSLAPQSGYMGRGSSQPVRIAPPIVSSRPAESYRSQGSQTYSAPRSYGPPAGYGAPRSFSAPSQGYGAPRTYTAPSGGGYAPRSYGGPSGGGYAPRTYAAPSGGGYAPRSYSGPSGGGYAPRTYSAPSGGGGRGYSAPSGGSAPRSYSAPRSSGGGGGSRASGGGGGGGSHGGGDGGHHR